MPQNAFICGLDGLCLTSGDARFLREAQPCGLILFRRNVESPDQVRALISEVRDAVGAERFLVLIDQEGGRVQRLSTPHWRRYPPAACFARLYRDDPERAITHARLSAWLMAADLHALGINTDCAPVLDIPVPGASDVIGDRAYGQDAASVIALGRAVAEGLLQGGVLPVAKHIPGHGRAIADSHFFLPVIKTPLAELEATDFQPFVALRDVPLAMTAHVILDSVDPRNAVTVSPSAIGRIIRGTIGFDGLLMSDDLSMRALSGRMGDRARAALDAGCDVALHCNGRMAEMEAVAAAAPPLSGESLRRFHAAFLRLTPPVAHDRGEAAAVVDEMLATMA